MSPTRDDRGGDVGERARALRVLVVAVVWFSGLATGFVGALAVAAKYGCGPTDGGLACRRSGTTLGVVIVLAAVAIVIAVTMTTHEKRSRRVAVVGVVGLAALAVCFELARSLLTTV